MNPSNNCTMNKAKVLPSGGVSLRTLEAKLLHSYVSVACQPLRLYEGDHSHVMLANLFVVVVVVVGGGGGGVVLFLQRSGTFISHVSSISRLKL